MIHHSTVRTRAPLRISFAGGGTDLPEFSDPHGGVVLSATIKRYAHCELTYNGQLEVKVNCDCLPGSGLGGSSAVCVAMILAMDARLGIERTKGDLADAAYRWERLHMQIAGGKQDQYAAAYGGLNLIEFHTVPEQAIESWEPVEVRPVTADKAALQRSLMLVYTGKARTDAGIQKKLAESCRDKASDLSVLKLVVRDMYLALTEGRISDFGKLLHSAWIYKTKVSPCTTSRADELYDVARKAGAWGGKLCGAGLGGYLLLCCDEERQPSVIRALEPKDCVCEAVEFEDEGAKAL